MSMYKKNSTIKNILTGVLAEEEINTYLADINFTCNSSQEIYENALSSLMKGDTETCIKYIIFGLDFDRKYLPLLNLCRAMLFGLSDIVNDAEFEAYRKKYKDFKSAKISLRGKINDLNQRQNELNNLIEELEEKLQNLKPTFFSLKKLYFIYKINSIKIKPVLQEYIFERDNSAIVTKKIEQELRRVNRLNKINISLQILTNIVQVCAIPVIFEK